MGTTGKGAASAGKMKLEVGRRGEESCKQGSRQVNDSGLQGNRGPGRTQLSGQRDEGARPEPQLRGRWPASANSQRSLALTQNQEEKGKKGDVYSRKRDRKTQEQSRKATQTGSEVQHGL